MIVLSRPSTATSPLVLMGSFVWGVLKLIIDHFKAVWANFSTLRWTVLVLLEISWDRGE